VGPIDANDLRPELIPDYLASKPQMEPDAMRLQAFNTATKTLEVNSTPYTLSEPEQRLRVLELSVSLLIARTKLGEFWTEGFRDATRFLEAVPLTTAEFAAAKRHLKNAFDYCELQEFGAATFEQRIVRGILQRL
jgi:hypothetical protein